MSEEQIRKHIRAALDEAIKVKKVELQQSLSEVQRIGEQVLARWQPVEKALTALKEEVGVVEGLSIDVTSFNARITVKGSSYEERYKIEPTLDEFEIAEYSYHSWAGDPPEDTTRFIYSADEVIAFVLGVVSEHIASKRAASSDQHSAEKP